MEIIRETTDFHLSEKTALSFGKFDGVHLGHRRLLEALGRKKEEGLKTVVFTFDSSPLSLKSGREIPVLTDRDEKNRLFAQAGIDLVIEYPFTEEVMHTEAGQFIDDVVRDRLNPAYIAVGDDFCFGRDRKGTAQLLADSCREFGCEVEIFPKLCRNGEEISSSLIRRRIAEGNMEEAAALLGRPYSFDGTIIHGNALGRTIGFPTLNLLLDGRRVMPPRGVYFTRTLLDGRAYYGLSNLGVRPTVTGDLQKSDLLLETHLLQYTEDAYGKDIEVSLYHYERAERRFADLAALQEQIRLDTGCCVSYFALTHEEG